jgi:hypothetical protein
MRTPRAIAMALLATSSAPVLAQDMPCEQSFSINRFIEGMNAVDQAVAAFELGQVDIILTELRKDLVCTNDRIHVNHLSRFGRQMALAGFFDQDPLAISYWMGLSDGDLPWPEDMNEEHPLRVSLEDLERGVVVDWEDRGLVPPKNTVLLFDGSFASRPIAHVEEAHFLQVLDRSGEVVRSVWQDGAIFDEDFLGDDPLPVEIPKWYTEPGPDLDPYTMVAIDDSLLEARRNQAAARAAKDQEQEEKRRYAMETEKVRAEKRSAKAQKRAVLLEKRAEVANAGLKPDEVVAAANAAPEEWVGFDFAAETTALSALDTVELAGSTDSTCTKLIALEPRAITGNLETAHVDCLERRLRHEDRQTTKNKISRLLMADAWSKKEILRWEATVKRHLEEIDRSDPDLCYMFARHQAKYGAERVDSTMKWANAALANSLNWEGATRVDRVLALHRINALAAEDKWYTSEDAFQQSRSSETMLGAEFWRNQTKSYAREWLEFADRSERDTEIPYRLCLSAAGAHDYCLISSAKENEG